ncbi:unnamed protein product [Oikopleura dioica]|uniref:SPX domain-containing protein n=1 Tax=Oikopleura dioica TaxID=34765 RepID=E4XZ03_OIKDI|nr:unnamed protein product [Oikopleura dioica]
MKFGQELASKLTSEWRGKYVDYNALKAVITRLQEESGQNEIKFRIMKSMISADYIEREKEKLSETFFELQEIEETKVNLFFNEKISYAHCHLADISRNCEEINMHKKKEQKRLKEAICEFYLFVKKLQAFQELNFTAFRKINKKHDKIMNSQEQHKFVC